MRYSLSVRELKEGYRLNKRGEDKAAISMGNGAFGMNTEKPQGKLTEE